MTEAGRRSIIIIGGGASGVILALHLLKSARPDLRVTLIEKRPAFGRGLAYSTTLDDHLLNVGAHGMSVFPDDPAHFRRWLARKGLGRADDAPYYAPRRVYGAYLQDLVAALEKEERTRLRLVHAEAVSVLPTASGVEVRLADGSSLVGHAVVLAVGHDEEPAPEQGFAIRIGSEADGILEPDAPVLILGTGLSMVDAYLSLEHRGHRGRVIAVSRRGLLPSPHRAGKPIRLDSADIPLGTDLSYFVAWFRDLVRSTEKAGGDWRDVVDGLRPFNQRIWQSWPTGAKRRFLLHTKAWWDIHRHRMAPEVHARIAQALETERLTLLAARIEDVTQNGEDILVHIRHRHSNAVEMLRVGRVYDCTGIVKNIEAGSIKLVRSLIEEGYAKADPLRLGLDVTLECAVIARDGSPSDRLFAVGPLTRGTFFEIDAIPEIRLQCAALAQRLVNSSV